MKFKIEKLESQLEMTRAHLEYEKQVNKDLTKYKSNTQAEKSELEGFFLECIEEVKKDIVKRKDI